MTNAMIDALTPAIIATQVRMERAFHKGAFLLLEGDDDYKIMMKFVDTTQCSMVLGYGKQRTIEALQLLEGQGFPGVLAIVDADFWRIEGVTPSSPNVLLTDSHDFETMMITSPAAAYVMAEFGSEEKIRMFEERTGRTVLAKLFQEASKIGAARLVSQRFQYELKFRQMDYDVVDSRTMEVDCAAVVLHVAGKSKPGINVPHVAALAEAELGKGHPQSELCHGKDLIGILARALRAGIGSQAAQVVAPQVVEKCLRIGYDIVAFGATTLYAAIRRWEATNVPYRVLA